MIRCIFNNRQTSKLLFDTFLPACPQIGSNVFIDDTLYNVYKTSLWLSSPSVLLDHKQPYYEIDLDEL